MAELVRNGTMLPRSSAAQSAFRLGCGKHCKCLLQPFYIQLWLYYTTLCQSPAKWVKTVGAYRL